MQWLMQWFRSPVIEKCLPSKVQNPYIYTDAPYLQELLANNFLQDAGLIGRDWVFGRPGFFGKTPPEHAAEPRDCPCRPRVSHRAGLALGLGLGLGSGWSGPT